MVQMVVGPMLLLAEFYTSCVLLASLRPAWPVGTRSSLLETVYGNLLLDKDRLLGIMRASVRCD